MTTEERLVKVTAMHVVEKFMPVCVDVLTNTARAECGILRCQRHVARDSAGRQVARCRCGHRQRECVFGNAGKSVCANRPA